MSHERSVELDAASATQLRSINIPDDILAEVGRIVVMFGWVEHSLSDLASDFVTASGKLPLQDVLSILTAEMSFKLRIGACDSLFRLFESKSRDNSEFQKLNAYPTPIELLNYWDRTRALLMRAEEERNSVVHSEFCALSGNEAVFVQRKVTAKQKKGLLHKSTEFSLKDLQAKSDLLGKSFACVFLLQVGMRNTSEGHWDQLDAVLTSCGH